MNACLWFASGMLAGVALFIAWAVWMTRGEKVIR